MDVTVRVLEPNDAEAYVALREEMLLESPLAFLASPDDDFASDPAHVRRQLADHAHAVVLGAVDPAGETLLAGAVGIHRQRHLKTAHKATIWGMYVRPGHRRRGIGRRLVEAALAHAGRMRGVTQVHLSVSETAAAARRLYEAAGFTVWGTEPCALFHEGCFADEHHMALALGATRDEV